MKKILIISLAALLLFSSCGRKKVDVPDPDNEASIVYASSEPEDLSDVIDLIYADIDMKDQINATYDDLSDVFHLDMTLVEDYSARYTSGRYGVADAAIIKLRNPEDTAEKEAVTHALEQRRDDRIAEFENYDVHDAFRIAKEAEVISRGNYMILLMLADIDAARTIILENIPG